MDGFAEVTPLLDLGLSGVLLATILWFVRRRELLVSSGDWLPRRVLEDYRSDVSERLADKDRQIEAWRTAHEAAAHTLEVVNAQNRDLVDALRASDGFFDAFRAKVNGLETGGVTDE